MALRGAAYESAFSRTGVGGAEMKQQIWFVEADDRLARLSAKGDLLADISAQVPRESFCGAIEAVVPTADESKKPAATSPARASTGRKGTDEIGGNNDTSASIVSESLTGSFSEGPFVRRRAPAGANDNE
jgi:hypothetical protein